MFRKPLPLFACRLRRTREQAGLSIPELARGAGLPPQTVHRLERGERQPALETAIKLAVALGCTLDHLAGLKS